MNEPKQVIVVRKDLNMRKGKIAAQAAHASMKVILDQLIVHHRKYNDDMVFQMALREDDPLYIWLANRFTKICVSVDSEQELLDVYEKAKQSHIDCALITDAGLTEFNGVPTNTCCAIGPDFPEVIDPITGHLKLL